jgi:starch synthase
MSFLKAGINYSECITTVSPRYAKEIQSPEYGFGFDGILARRARRLCGILNGIDTVVWNPAADPYLPKPYGPESLADKVESKRAMLDAMGLPVTPATLRRPAVGLVSRLVDQKGFDLLAQMADQLTGIDATFVLLGTGEARYQALWQALHDGAPDRIGVWFGFNDRLAHLIEAGADIFLMPSRFEPCGLNQMYSLRYGTVPVVRAIGGLDDTIENWNARARKGNGFKFKDYTADALVRTLAKAVQVYGDRDAWRALQLEGMKQDHSWETSAREYVKVYEKAIRAARR